MCGDFEDSSEGEDDDDEDEDDDEESELVENTVKVERDISALSSSQKLNLLKAEAPELLGLLQEYKVCCLCGCVVFCFRLADVIFLFLGRVRLSFSLEGKLRGCGEF